MGIKKIPYFDFSAVLDKLQAIADNVHPTASGTTITPTGMHIVTEDDVQGAISELDAGLYATNQSLTQKTEVKEKTVTGTTNAYGAINLGLPWATNEIVAVVCSDNTKWCIPFPIGSSTYAKVLADVSAYTPLANTSVTLTVRYREYTVSP